MEVLVFPLGPIATNAYLCKQGDRVVLIDPGAEADEVLDFLAEKKWELEAILLTHAHFDHIASLDRVREVTGAPAYLHAAEADWLADPVKNGSSRWPEIGTLELAPAEHLLEGGERLPLLSSAGIQVIATPGHSPGSVIYQIERNFFCGDLLFQGSVGRTDMYGGDPKALQFSLQALKQTMQKEDCLWPGHGPETTWGQELRTSPWLQIEA